MPAPRSRSTHDEYTPAAKGSAANEPASASPQRPAPVTVVNSSMGVAIFP